MQALLSFENAPPFAAPTRFFLTAPLFLVLAGLLAAFEGADIFASRWMPATLAATHLVTIGFMLQVMLGALIQILPVMAGANLAQPSRVAAIVHVGLTLGALLLAGGFYFGVPRLLSLAALLLGLTSIYFLQAAGRALLGVPSTSPTIHGLKLALLGLAGVVGLGVALALAIAHGWSLPMVALTDLHAGWGMGAWAGILLAAMSYVVVPMFQLTPGYPARPSWWFPGLICGLLLLWSAAVLLDWPVVASVGQSLAAVAGIAFAALTLRLQAQRRRAKIDVTYRYWQIGLLASMLALAMLPLAEIFPALADISAWTPVFGILLLLGGFVPFIVGMLYKIVPFLAWQHLQHCGQMKILAPNMSRILPDLDMQRQLKSWGLALVMLLLAAIRPDWLARPAGLAMAVGGGWLWWNLLGAIRRYRLHRSDMVARLAAL